MTDPLPDILYSLANGTTIELGCRRCDRAHVVDMVEMLDRRGLGFQMRNLRDRLRCRVCGGRPSHVGGQMVDTLRQSGRLHRLAASRDFQFPPFASRPKAQRSLWSHLAPGREPPKPVVDFVPEAARVPLF